MVMKNLIFALSSVFFLIFTCSMAEAQAAHENSPQEYIVCSGTQALCTFARCELSADKKSATCNCWVVNDDFIVVISSIQDPVAQKDTQDKCTASHPCAKDEAPICAKIANGTLVVDGVTAQYWSAFSYIDFCRLWNPVNCDEGYWADCMLAPCKQSDSSINRASCKCKVSYSPFKGPSGYCRLPQGMVLSTIDVNFDISDLPGGVFVQEALRPLPE